MHDSVSVSARACLRLPGRGLRRGGSGGAPAPRIRTGIVGLDVLVGGGFPRGVLTQIVGAESSGRTTLAYSIVGAVTKAGEYAAWVDLPDALDAEHAGSAGICLPRLLWVRPQDLWSALRAAELLLETGGFTVVLVDLTDARVTNRSVSPAGWLRLARAAARSRSAVVTVGFARSGGMFVTLRLETERSRVDFNGDSEPFLLFEGITGAVHLRKNKLGPSGSMSARFLATCAS